MRVLVVVEACGGVARHVADLCCGLHAHGIDVHLLYSPTREDPLLSSGLARLAALAVPASAVAMVPEPGLADLRAGREIRRYLRDHGPFDVIHGHSSKGGALARLAGIGGPAVRVYTPHAFVTMNAGMPLTGRLFYRSVERFLATLTDAVIVLSPAEFEHARACLRIPAGKLHLVPNGIDLAVREPGSPRHALRSLWGVREDEVVIGTVARLVPQKSPELLLRAFAAARDHRAGLRLVMAGDGPLRQSLEHAAARLGIADAVIWTGYIEGRRIMPAFDIFAMSSRYEGFPYTLLEALAAGLPVVTTAVGGAEMVVTEGVNGCVVPVGGERELAACLGRLVASPADRLRMGRASLTRAAEFTVARMVRDTIAVYRALLEPPRQLQAPAGI